MYVTLEELERIGDMAQSDDQLLSMLVEWNDTKDWGEQDMIMSRIVRYVKEKDLAHGQQSEEVLHK